MAGFLGSGDLYFRRTTNGVLGGWKRFGNATKLEIKENVDEKQRISSQRLTDGSALDTVNIKKPTTIELILDDINRDNLSLAFLGTNGSTVVAAGTSTSEPQTIHTVGGAIKTDFDKISNVVVKDVTDATTYVAGTDYNVLDSDMGLVDIVSGGAISDGDVLHVTYDYAARTSNTVDGGTQTSIIVELMLNGENFVDQSRVKVSVWKTVLSPSSGIDFLDDNFATIPLKGTVIVPSDKVSGYLDETDIT